ncbi:MAG: hypothetical protein ACRDGV_00180 [Candidatus Limnocylindria bacterium]
MRRGRGVRFAWLARLVGAALAIYLRLVARTCRISGEVSGDQVVLAFWHEFNMACFVVALARRRRLRHASFSTRGFRGVVITSMLQRSGSDLRVLPLPAEDDRAAARDFALRLAGLSRSGRSPVVTPDGPFGPYRVAKPGALIVARQSGLPIQPWAVAAHPAIRLTRRWDRQLVPLPFCHIRLAVGPRLHVAPRDRLRRRLPELQAAMDATTAATARGG